MSEKTHAEIVSEMRFHAQLNIDAGKNKPELGILATEGKITNDYADDLEEAHEREVDDLRQQRDLWSKRAAELVEMCNELYAKLKQVGNAAKLREALVYVNEHTYRDDNDDLREEGCRKIEDVIDEALAAPARNCDVGTAKNQTRRFSVFCGNYDQCMTDDSKCPLIEKQGSCEFEWGQMPYEEGGAK